MDCADEGVEVDEAECKSSIYGVGTDMDAGLIEGE